MKITLTKWERETLYNIFQTIPSGNLGQIEQDMRILNKLKLSDKDTTKVFVKDLYNEKELKQLNNLLGKVNANLWNIIPMKQLVPNPDEADVYTELALEKKDISRLCNVAEQGEGYPRHPRTLELKKSIDSLKDKIK